MVKLQFKIGVLAGIVEGFQIYTRHSDKKIGAFYGAGNNTVAISFPIDDIIWKIKDKEFSTSKRIKGIKIKDNELV